MDTEGMRPQDVRRLVARESPNWMEPPPYRGQPPTVVWPEAPFDTLVVAEQIRRNVTPRRPAYRAPIGPQREYITRICREINDVIARNLRTLRARAGLRQIDLAAATGLSASTICRIERAKRPATFDEIVRLATQLAVPLEFFLDPPADHIPTPWVRRRRIPPPTPREELDYLRAIFEDEVEDLMDFTGKTREELENEWFGLDEFLANHEFG